MLEVPRIALIVDHPERDLAGIVLAAAELCRRGARPYLVSMSMMSQEIWALAPDHVVLNYFRNANQEFGRQLIEAGINVSLLDTEGGVLASLESYSGMLWSDHALLGKASAFCMWGGKLAGYLGESGIAPPGRIKVTGCPRFDFYHPRWRSVLSNGSGERRTLLLLNSNHTLANPRFVKPEREVELYVTQYGRNREEMQTKQALDRKALESIAKLASDLARDFPEFDVVLRPHPFERRDTYLELLAPLPNLNVVQDGPVQPWVVRASAVIQRNCSTAIEAGMAGVPALSPQWYESYFNMPASEAVSVGFPRYEDLRDAVSQISAGSFSVPPKVREALAATIADWFCSADGESHRRVCDALLDVQAGGDIDYKFCRRNLYCLDTSSGFATDLGNRLRHALRLHPTWSFARMANAAKDSWVRTAKYFSPEQVQQLVDRISAQAGWNDRFHVHVATDRTDYRAGTGLGYSIAIDLLR